MSKQEKLLPVDEDDYKSEFNISENDQNQEEEEEDDEFEQDDRIDAIRSSGRTRHKADPSITSKLIESFGRLVHWEPRPNSIHDNKGKYRDEDKVYSKLAKAATNVLRVLAILKDKEDFDNRKLTLFIYRQKWVHSQLKPLLELCRQEDSLIALRCCKLAIFLTRGLTQQSLDCLNTGKKKSKKPISEQQNEDDRDDELNERKIRDEDEGERNDDGGDKQKKENVKRTSEEILKQQIRLQNVKDQISSFLSIKEALCSESCNQSVVHAFHLAWTKECRIPIEMRNKIVEPKRFSEERKEIALCMSYFRRLLAVDYYPDFSTAQEIVMAKRVHNSFIVNIRQLLPIFSAICSSIQQRYHDSWLTDIIQILYCMTRDFDAKDMFRVWRENALIPITELIPSTDRSMDISEDKNKSDNESDNESDSNSDEEIPFDVTVKKSLPEVIVPKNVLPKIRSSTEGGPVKKLAFSLKQQREERLHAMIDSRSSRFKATYVKVPETSQMSRSSTSKAVSSSSTTTTMIGIGNKSSSTFGNLFDVNTNIDNTEQPEENKFMSQTTVKSNLKIIKSVLPNQLPIRPVENMKRNKKHLTFAPGNPVVEEVKMKNLTTDEGQKALIVAATLVEMLTSYDENDSSSIPGIRQLIIRVNEDRRRNDAIIGEDMELIFYQVVSKCLMYNRLKLSERKRNQNAMNSEEWNRRNVETKDRKKNRIWEPQVKNIINALDKMSLNRVITSIENYREHKNYTNLTVSVEMYKEQIANFRILLESDNDAHNDIALAGIYRIFYSSSERLDPLSKLLTAFKPGNHEKKYLHILVELVHETLKTLESAYTRYHRIMNDDNNEMKQRMEIGKYKKSKGKEIDYEIYVSSCIGFDVKEYFKRLVTNHSILLYSKLLKEYRSLDSHMIHYIYCFLQRICIFPLEQRYPTLPTMKSKVSNVIESQSDHPMLLFSSSGLSTQNYPPLHHHHHHSIEYGQESQGLTLMYMLFNYYSIKVMNDILQDPHIDKMSQMINLVRLIKSIVRQLGLALDKNHLLFVEILFNHTRPHEFCETIDNVYEAVTYRHLSKPMDTLSVKKGMKGKDSKSLSYDNGTDGEVDESSPDKIKDNGFSSKSHDDYDDNRSNNDSDSDGVREEEFNDDIIFANIEETTVRRRNDKKRRDLNDFILDGNSKVSHKKRQVRWTEKEDDIVKELYHLYNGTRSLFTMIAEDEKLRSIGNNRSAIHVEKRVVQLKLHLLLSDNEEEEREDDNKNMNNDDDSGSGEGSLKLVVSRKKMKSTKHMVSSTFPESTGDITDISSPEDMIMNEKSFDIVESFDSKKKELENIFNQSPNHDNRDKNITTKRKVQLISESVTKPVWKLLKKNMKMKMSTKKQKLSMESSLTNEEDEDNDDSDEDDDLFLEDIEKIKRPMMNVFDSDSDDNHM